MASALMLHSVNRALHVFRWPFCTAKCSAENVTIIWRSKIWYKNSIIEFGLRVYSKLCQTQDISMASHQNHINRFFLKLILSINSEGVKK